MPEFCAAPTGLPMKFCVAVVGRRGGKCRALCRALSSSVPRRINEALSSVPHPVELCVASWASFEFCAAQIGSSVSRDFRFSALGQAKSPIPNLVHLSIFLQPASSEEKNRRGQVSSVPLAASIRRAASFAASALALSRAASRSLTTRCAPRLVFMALANVRLPRMSNVTSMMLPFGL